MLQQEGTVRTSLKCLLMKNRYALFYIILFQSQPNVTNHHEMSWQDMLQWVQQEDTF